MGLPADTRVFDYSGDSGWGRFIWRESLVPEAIAEIVHWKKEGSINTGSVAIIGRKNEPPVVAVKWGNYYTPMQPKTPSTQGGTTLERGMAATPA